MPTPRSAVAPANTSASPVSHAPKGFSNLEGGYEFNLALAAAALGLLLAGPGPLSVHELVERRLEGPLAWLPGTRERRAVRTVKLLK